MKTPKLTNCARVPSSHSSTLSVNEHDRRQPLVGDKHDTFVVSHQPLMLIKSIRTCNGKDRRFGRTK